MGEAWPAPPGGIWEALQEGQGGGNRQVTVSLPMWSLHSRALRKGIWFSDLDLHIVGVPQLPRYSPSADRAALFSPSRTCPLSSGIPLCDHSNWGWNRLPSCLPPPPPARCLCSVLTVGGDITSAGALCLETQAYLGLPPPSSSASPGNILNHSVRGNHTPLLDVVCLPSSFLCKNWTTKNF